MRVLSIHAGSDTGGGGWGLTNAFRGHPDIQFRSVVQKSNYIDYPHDATWDQAATLWAAADVVHLHTSYRTERHFLHLGRKPYVLHHHGTHYRVNYGRLNREVNRRRAHAVVSTLDLLQYGPDLTWSPAAHNLEHLATLRQPRTGPLRIGHAPTNREIKSTDAFLRAVEKLAETEDVEPVVIENATWADCLAIKGTCDIYFDQVQLGYGNNAIEAWAMGIPVVCGAEDSTLEEMTQRFGSLPFKLADEGSIYAALLDLCDPVIRTDYARRGLAHARQWHDGTETVRVLSDVYANLAA